MVAPLGASFCRTTIILIVPKDVTAFWVTGIRREGCNRFWGVARVHEYTSKGATVFRVAGPKGATDFSDRNIPPRVQLSLERGRNTARRVQLL